MYECPYRHEPRGRTAAGRDYLRKVKTLRARPCDCHGRAMPGDSKWEKIRKDHSKASHNRPWHDYFSVKSNQCTCAVRTPSKDFRSLIGQEAAWRNPDDRTLYQVMLTMRQLSHAAYDVPRKFTGVLRYLGQKLQVNRELFPNNKICYGVFIAQNSFAAIRRSCNPRLRRRFWRVLEVSRAFRCRKLMKFPRVPVQKVHEVPDGSGGSGGSGADNRHGSGGFRCRWLIRFRGVVAQRADKVPEGCGADSERGFGRLRCT